MHEPQLLDDHIHRMSGDFDGGFPYDMEIEVIRIPLMADDDNILITGTDDDHPLSFLISEDDIWKRLDFVSGVFKSFNEIRLGVQLVFGFGVLHVFNVEHIILILIL